MNRTIPIVRPFFPRLDGALSSRLSRVLEEGNVTNHGPYVQDFEAVLSKFTGMTTICFSSGFSALVTMLMAYGVEGRDVIIPSFTFPATPNAVLAAKGNIVYADIKPDTLTIDPEDVARKINRSTACIMPVDVYGISACDDDLYDVLLKHRVPILSDSCPSFGTHCTIKKTRLGFDYASAYSFHATKQLAVGEGGCIASWSHEFIERCRKIRNFGLDHQIWTGPGINGKMTEISALIGLESMKTFIERNSRRRVVKHKLNEALKDVPHIKTFKDPQGQTVNWLYAPVIIGSGAPNSRDGVVHLLRDYGVYTRTYYPACFKGLPVTDDIASHIIALPCYESMTDYEIEYIREAFLRIMGEKH